MDLGVWPLKIKRAGTFFVPIENNLNSFIGY